MDNINGWNTLNTSTNYKNVPTQLHRRCLQDWGKTKRTYPRRKGPSLQAIEPSVASCIASGLGAGLRMGMERTQRHRRPGGKIKSCCYYRTAQGECSVQWPQETSWRNDLGLFFPELLKLCYIMGLRSLGHGWERRSKGDGWHLGVRVSYWEASQQPDH